jgi:hypothetical protein
LQLERCPKLSSIGGSGVPSSSINIMFAGSYMAYQLTNNIFLSHQTR